MSQAGKYFTGATPPPAGFVETLTGDIGGPVPPTAGNINVITGVALNNAGSSVDFTGSSGTSTLVLNVTDTNDNTLLGLGTGNILLTTAFQNTAFGAEALTQITTENNNTAMGFQALNAATSSLNTAVGSGSLILLSTGSENTAIGSASGVLLSTGNRNTFLGTNAGGAYTTGSNNISVGYNVGGTIAESFATRIGIQGTQTTAFIAGITGVVVANTNMVTINTVTGQLGSQAVPASSITITGDSGGGLVGNSFTFTGGTTGLTFAGAGTTETLGGTLAISHGGTNATAMTNTDGVVYFDGTRLVTTTVGTATNVLTSNGAGVAPTFQAPAASSITITGNTGGALAGNAFTFITANSTVIFAGAGTTQTLDFSRTNNLVFGSSLPALAGGDTTTSIGVGASNAMTSGLANSILGYQAFRAATSGSSNVVIGYQALIGGNPSNNIAIGASSLPGSTGNGNIGIGPNAFSGTTSGAFNLGIGISVGANLITGTESSNIYIQNSGVNAESNVLRIGTSGSSALQINKCFIAGIDGVNVGSVARVVTESSDQLGTAVITGGTGISVTPGANTITISATGTTSLTYTNVNATPYVVLTTDEYLSVDTSALSITVQLPNAATSGRVFIIKDRTGAAATRNITVTTVGGAVNIDGATTFVMNTNFQAIQVIGNGSTYEIF